MNLKTIKTQKIRSREICIVDSVEMPLFSTLGKYIVTVDGFPTLGFRDRESAEEYVNKIMNSN